MSIDRSIRCMTPQEIQAKREWGTGACQARGCTTRAGFLVMESAASEPESEEWWQYCCPKHARQFADRHGLEIPDTPGKSLRDAVA
jgi:hypothetical protein